ncbi:MAG TPA: N-acetylmuramoyl-L-alanine amidase-like domain-containing protein [Phycisphaerae bacterium]
MTCLAGVAREKTLVRLIVVGALCAMGVYAGPSVALAGDEQAVAASKPPEDLETRPLYTFTEGEVDRYLHKLHEREPDFARRVIHLGRKNIGQPYQIYLLGEFPYERYDPDPLYCLSKSDCVTFCEHMYAMAFGHDWATFFRALQRIRYKDGVIGMLTRNHYTESDWDRNNAFLFEDLTEKLGGGQASVPMHERISRAKFFAKFGIGQDIPDEDFVGSYIPKERVEAILSELRDADFVNIIRGDANSQWAGHTGLIALAPDGTVDFLHSAEPAVREQPLLDFLEKDKRCVGIKILRPRAEAQTVMDAILAASAPSFAHAEAAPRFEVTDVKIAFPTATQPSSATRPASDRAPESKPADAAPQPKTPETRPDSPHNRTDHMPRTRELSRRLQSYLLDFDAAADAQLQNSLDEIDRKLGEQLGIPDAHRACGLLDLTDLRLALVRPDEMFYGASVPKICILLAYFETYPEAAERLDPGVERDLQLMIKQSDNELAAKYSQLIGLDRIQEIVQSDKYRFYDPDHGGGLWCGKHYGLDQPRHGDPLHDHSHGATVRQCLRYYLLLEQGKLVSPAASAKMKSIFAATLLDFHPHAFVAGLRGRGITLLRKSGEWEDWHLDTARIEHGDRMYLLAAMAHDPKGQEYLAALAAGVDELLCRAQPRAPFVQQFFLHDSADTFRRGNFDRAEPDDSGVRLAPNGEAATYESPLIETDSAFNEVLISWNVDAPPQTGFRVELRVGRRFDDSWSPYLYVGSWGDVAPEGEKITTCDQGRIDVDWFRSEQRFDRWRYRIRAVRSAGILPASDPSADQRLRIARMAVCCSDSTGLPLATAVGAAGPYAPARKPPRDASEIPASAWQRRVPVPFRSQKLDDRKMSGQICSPTSLSMAMEYRGVNRPTLEVCQRVFDPEHRIYGNWPRNVQAAFSFGVPGYLRRFSDWEDVKRMIAADQPLIVSIRAEQGEITGAPYRSTDGHLLVIVGFDRDGDVEVNDPAAATPERGQTVYKRADLERVWMAKGGTAYVLLPR